MANHLSAIIAKFSLINDYYAIIVQCFHNLTIEERYIIMGHGCDSCHVFNVFWCL